MPAVSVPARHRTALSPVPRRGLAGLAALLATAGASAAGAGAAQVPVSAQHATDTAGGGQQDPRQEAQVLSVPQSQQISDLAGQLDSAVQFAQQRVAADLQSRAPETVKPTDGTYTSGFEVRWGTMHKGIDLAAPLGTPIVAAQKGTVINAGPASGFGNWVRIAHDDGTITVYGHMQTIDVTVGQRVTAGQRIAGVGSEGFSTGPHCHFEVYPDGVNAIDPVGWLADRGIAVA